MTPGLTQLLAARSQAPELHSLSLLQPRQAWLVVSQIGAESGQAAWQAVQAPLTQNGVSALQSWSCMQTMLGASSPPAAVASLGMSCGRGNPQPEMTIAARQASRNHAPRP